MTRVALQSLLWRRFRAVVTMLAIVLGVAMVAGTLVLTDTISRTFDRLFAGSHKGVSVVVSGRRVVDRSLGQSATVPAATLAAIRRVPGVAAAAGATDDDAQIIGRDGRPITTLGPPTRAEGIDFANPRLNPYTLVQGRWPRGPGEVAVNRATAARQGFRAGERIGVTVNGRLRMFRLTGTVQLAGMPSLGGATFAVFELRTAQALFHKSGRFDSISVAARPGVPAARLAGRIRPLLGRGLQALTARRQEQADAADVRRGLGFMRSALLAFAAIALGVGSLVIFNTISITVAQRTRELAILRTLGARRRQVLRSVLLEALVLGALGSLGGIATGLLLAQGLMALLEATGVDLPAAGLVLAPRTVVASLALGTATATVAGLLPAWRATRVAPLAAVRQATGAPPSRTVAPLRALTALAGFPATRLGGTPGRLARENAVRHPGRTATTAAALAVGLALVTFVAVLGRSVQASVVDSVSRQVRADYVVAGPNGQPFAAAAGDVVERAPFVELASSVRGDSARIGSSSGTVTGIDARTLPRLYRFVWQPGSERALARLGPRGAVVTDALARRAHLRRGSTLALLASDGSRLTVVVRGIYAAPALGSPLGDVAIARATFDATFPRPRDRNTYVRVRPHTHDAQARLARRLAGFPSASVQTKAEFVAVRAKRIGLVLNLLYVLLALSVVVGVLGMVNALALAVVERTRELGMLRAIGMSRRQVRRMMRHESVITAVLGAAAGLPVGVLLGLAATAALAAQGVVFAVPAGAIAVFALVAVAVGLVAAILPARRASGIEVLAALHYE